MNELDEKIKAAASIDVPESLEERLLAIPDTVAAVEADVEESIRGPLEVSIPETLEAKLLAIPEQHKHDDTGAQGAVVHAAFGSQKSNKIQLAVAASIAFVIGFSFTLFDHKGSAANFTELALNHYHYEFPFSLHKDADHSLDDVNAKMAAFGASLLGKPGKISYARFCDFGKQPSLHLVMESEFGQVTVFVTHKDKDNQIDSQFSDGRFVGRSFPLQNADFTIISENGLATEDQYKKIRDYVRSTT